MGPQQEEAKTYRGIKLAESVRVFKKNGEYNLRVKLGLDSLVDALEKRGHTGLGEYVGNFEKFLIDFKCGHEPYEMMPANYKKGASCLKCVGMCPEEVEKKFYLAIQTLGYKVHEEYKTARTKIKLECDKGHIFEMIPNAFNDGQKCSVCAWESRYEKVQAVQVKKAKLKFIDKVIQNNHSWIDGEYINNRTKLLIDFHCSHEPNWISPDNYIRGRGCPYCSESNGEKVIREYLEELGIVCVSEYSLPNSRKRYDLLLPFENTIVEIHGEQHYEEVDFSGCGKGRTLTQEKANDKEKKEYAEKLGYNYIVVDYREHDPDLALKRFVESYNKLNAVLSNS